MNAVGLVGCVAIALCGCGSAKIGDSPGGADAAASQPDGASTPDASLVEPADAAPGVPDGAPAGPDASVAERCTAGYGDVPGFVLCEAVAGACGFIALNGATSCDEHCSAGGGTCVSALDNEVGLCDEFEDDQTGIGCATIGKADLLCRCTVP